jgi:energy-coupling factor transport system permease protein
MFHSNDTPSAPAIHPAAAALFAAALSFWMLALDQPGAVLGGVVAVFAWLAAEGALASVAAMAAPPAILIAAINVLFVGRGESVIARLPSWWPGGGALTLEAACFGLVSGAKLAGVMAVFAVWARISETDRSIAWLGRAAPRTAVTLAIAMRLIPELLRDARRIHGVLWSRGIHIAAGSIRHRAAAAGMLWRTLLAASLDGASDLSEALAARGFGSGRRTSFEPDRLTGRDWTVTAAALSVASAAAWALATGRGLCAFYPALEPAKIRDAMALAAAPLSAAGAVWLAWRLPSLRSARRSTLHV